MELTSNEIVKQDVEEEFAVLQAKFNGTRNIVYFLRDHLLSAYEKYKTEGHCLPKCSVQVLVRAATYFILFCSVKNFRSCLQPFVDDYGLMYYIAFLLGTSNRKYIRSILSSTTIIEC